MILLKTKEEIKIIQEGGRRLNEVLRKVIGSVREGVTTLDLDKVAEEEIIKKGGQPSFKMVPNYHWAACICLNEIVVHGIPNKVPLKKGDILGIDLGMFYQGWHTDTAWTIQVGKEDTPTRFLKTGQEVLKKAISLAVAGHYLGHISLAIQQTIEKEGYSPVRQLTGHGIGRKLHEEPAIPCVLKGQMEKTPLLKEGMVLAIEVIYNMGKSGIVYKNNDGWTIISCDGLPSATFEHTVAVTQNGPLILTGGFDII